MNLKHSITPIAVASNDRIFPEDDNWAGILTRIQLADWIPDDAIAAIEAFSHLEIIYGFHLVDSSTVMWSGVPRENPAYPIVGIFAQRKKDRPNGLGLCTVQLLKVDNRTLYTRYFDGINGTPIFDIKPVYKEFEPVGPITQPKWTKDLMKHYW